MQTDRRTVLVFVGLQLGMILSTLDGTIVATAMPTIVRDIGGFSRVTWVVTAYLLAQVASMPLYGKLGDTYGRKRMILGAITLFLFGSVCCGLAQSMDQLLAARFVQGLGGGGLGALGMAVVAEIVPARQLGRWLGYQGVMFAVSSAVGPLVGGAFVDHLSWRWGFLVNVPIGAVAFLLVAGQLRPSRGTSHRIDWLGAALLTSSVAGVVLVASTGGNEVAWLSAPMAGLVVATIALWVAFGRREVRAPEPVVPLHLFRDRVVRVSGATNFTSGLLLWCGIFFVPMYMQEVQDVSASRSGLVLVPLMFGCAFGTLVSGRLVERTGRIRPWVVAGSVMMAAGAALLATLQLRTPIGWPALFSLVLGTGVGLVMQPSLLAGQNAVAHQHLGIATSSGLLLRMMGSLIGLPILGSILQARLPGTGLQGPAAFADALPWVFGAAVPVAVVSVLVGLRLEERPLREEAHAPGDQYVLAP